MLPVASTRLLLINSRLVYNSRNHGSFIPPLVMHELLAACTDDLPTIADFKPDLRAALDDRFALSQADAASHPFHAAL